MAQHWLSQLTGHDWPLIGMVHLRPLPGSPRDDGRLDATVAAAVADAEALVAGGAAAVLVENYGDAPFFPGRVPPVTVAALTRCVLAVRAAVAVPVGVNVLRNDGRAALAIAAVCGARFVRVNVLTGAMVTDQGVIEGAAHTLLRERRALGADVRILADVAVKHAAPLAATSLSRAAADTAARGLADALLVSGGGTGEAPLAAAVAEVAAAAPEGVPVLLGSGLTPESAPALVPGSAGAIVGTWLKRDGVVTAPVDRDRVRALVAAVAAATTSPSQSPPRRGAGAAPTPARRRDRRGAEELRSS